MCVCVCVCVCVCCCCFFLCVCVFFFFFFVCLFVVFFCFFFVCVLFCYYKFKWPILCINCLTAPVHLNSSKISYTVVGCASSKTLGALIFFFFFSLSRSSQGVTVYLLQKRSLAKNNMADQAVFSSLSTPMGGDNNKEFGWDTEMNPLLTHNPSLTLWLMTTTKTRD